jgi:class 3 adenylate cyclase
LDRAVEECHREGRWIEPLRRAIGRAIGRVIGRAIGRVIGRAVEEGV